MTQREIRRHGRLTTDRYLGSAALFLLLSSAQETRMTDSFPSILCVDHDPEVLERLKEHFTAKGFIVLTAANGIEACLQVKRWAPTAVILDLFIPRLGGIGTLGRIRAMDPAIPVILTSAAENALAHVADAGLSVTGALVKPLDLARMSELLAGAGVQPAEELMPASGRPARRRQARARVLVVDDEDEFREILAEYLAGKGLEVREARSGEDALLLVPEFHPDIVLLDVMMEGIGGIGALREIAAIAPGTCVIMVTAVQDLDVARWALACGAADYVTKPFPLQYLDSVIEVHMPVRPAGTSREAASLA
jgi:DNA-binding response OmpR family regulator